jgi:hypothetical protein
VRRIAPLVAALALVAGCGGNDEAATPREVKSALEARLVDKNLSFEWVYCLRTKLEFEGRDIVRCNVNFGEPHIVIYCAVLDEGRLITNRERPAIRCGRNARS